jgi:hypothetical protein
MLSLNDEADEVAGVELLVQVFSQWTEFLAVIPLSEFLVEVLPQSLTVSEGSFALGIVGDLIRFGGNPSLGVEVSINGLPLLIKLGYLGGRGKDSLTATTDGLTVLRNFEANGKSLLKISWVKLEDD